MQSVHGDQGYGMLQRVKEPHQFRLVAILRLYGVALFDGTRDSRGEGSGGSLRLLHFARLAEKLY